MSKEDHPVRLLMLLLLMGVGCLAAAGEVYQWTDENGRVHFGDRPLGDDSQQVQIKITNPVTQPSLEQAERERKRRRLLEVYQADRASKQADAKKAQQARVEKQQQCQEARQRFARFNRPGGVYETDDNGERRYLDETQRSRFVEKLRDEVDRLCGK